MHEIGKDFHWDLVSPSLTKVNGILSQSLLIISSKALELPVTKVRLYHAPKYYIILENVILIHLYLRFVSFVWCQSSV